MNKFKIKFIDISDVKKGKCCTIIKPSNLYSCSLGDNVFIGPFVEIQRGAKIGSFTRVSSHSFICELVTIGDNCFIGHGVMFINDLFKNGKTGGKIENWQTTHIGDNVLIGSNSTILPVKICDHVVIGAGSVVTKNITKTGIYFGNPAKFIRDI